MQFKRGPQSRHRVLTNDRCDLGLNNLKLSAGDDGQLSAPLGHDNQFLVPSGRIVHKRQ